MSHPKEILFGPVPDEQRDYWQRNRLAQRDASLLDSHFDSRARGNRWKNAQDPSVNAYAIPRNMKVPLKETSVGGLLTFDGASAVWDEHYARAQSRLLQRNDLPNQLPDPWNGRRAQMSEEIDGGAILQQRMLSNMAAPGGSTHGPMPGHMLATGQQRSQQAGPSVCTLMEGHTFYQSLQIQGFGTTQPLAKTGGQIKGVQGRQFQVEGMVTAYVVDGLQTIDLSKMEPGRLKPLVRVTAPLLGTFLVPQEAIQEMGGSGMGTQRQMLIDSSQQHQVSQRQQWAAQQQAQAQSLLISQGPQPRQPMNQPVQQGNRPMNPQEMLQAQSRELMRRRGLLKG